MGLPAMIHHVGEHSGTLDELAAYTKVAPTNFWRRLKKFKEGKYSVEKTMHVGRLSTKNNDTCGTDEWKSLSHLLKDARLRVQDIPDNWLHV